MSIVYFTTNENLEAITQCMELARNDNVLAICGSGDQAFAMCEYAGSVIAMDNNPAQVRWAEDQRGYIRDGLFEGFIEQPFSGFVKNSKVRNEYFRRHKSEIQANLGRITFMQGDIFTDAPKAKYSRIYLSNALSGTASEKEADIFRIARLLKPNGILYDAAGDFISRTMCSSLKISKYLEKDERLTEKAHQIEREWDAYVYRRRA